MITSTRTWRRLSQETIADLPETGAVFEVANLVRTIQFIGGAAGNLRNRIATYVQDDLRYRPIPGGYYVRYESAAAEDEALASRLAGYREQHGGMMPPGNSELAVPLRLAQRRAA
jgi:hypothetical protein